MPSGTTCHSVVAPAATLRIEPGPRYFTGAVAEVVLVDFFVELFACLAFDFFGVLVTVVLLVVELEVVPAGVLCASSETPARAIVIVRPRIVETVFFMMFYSL